MTESNLQEDRNTQSLTDIEDKGQDEAEFAWPTVVAVVVAHNPGDWLEQCLASVKAQNYPDLTTLVVDVCSKEDLTARVAKALPSAFVRRVEEDINFAQAINTAVDSIEGATYVLVCHDDVILGPNSLTNLVEEAFRSNASIIGPKIIDAENSDHLLEVGGMIDRFGVPFSGIEPDEVDQGQHDGVRDVFFVSSAAMLVRADLFRALGGFDPKCFPGAEDIDIAWRARLVGARVLVQPDAVVGHHKTSDRQRKNRTSKTAIVARHRMRAVLKNSSKRSLMWILPLSFFLHSIEGIVWLVRLDPKRAWLLFSGWIWNIKNIKDTKKLRSKIQKTREVSDRTIAAHQVGGSARFRRFISSIVQSRQLKSITNASKSFATTSYSKRTRETPIYLTALVVYLISVRSIFRDGLTSVGEFVLWPSFSQQVSAIFKGGLLASEYPMVASTFGRIIAASVTLVFGMNEGLAQTVFTVSMIPIGCFGVRLLLKDRGIGTRSIAIGAITYGMLSFGLQSFSNGDFGAIVMLAGLPYFLRALANKKGRQAGLAGGVIVAFSPASIPILVVLSFFYLLLRENSEISFIADTRNRLKVVSISAVIMAVLNAGLLIDLMRNLDRSAFGISDTTPVFSEYIFANTKLTIIFFVSLAMVFSALVVGRKERTGEVRLLTLTVTTLFCFVMLSIHFAQPIFEVSIAYVLIQLSVAISIAVVINAFNDELKLRSFGPLHFLSAITSVAVLASVLLGVSVLQDGRFGLPDRSWSNQIEIEQDERVLYLGDSRTLPGRTILAPLNRSFSIGDNASVTFSRSFVGPASPLDEQVRDIYSAMMASETSHAGYLLARLGIGVVAVPNSRAPGTTTLDQDRQLLDALDRQTDLVRLRDRPGLVVFKNTAFEKSYSTSQYVEDIEPSQVLDQRVEGTDELVLYEAKKVTPESLISITLSIIGLFMLLLWPRRHHLLKYKSTFGVEKPTFESNSIDLTNNEDHKVDQKEDGSHSGIKDEENKNLESEKVSQ